ncbi:type 2 lanthipeptide synthetase LanM family protein [Nonomuraea sp. NPDC050328]|uniref:type 2 lanthipeptide synthetase LanM family protein n=1 Tax=Nonomuraea sp. NPDC050328 TaxID=3364361 RepID=UPI0037A7455F
MTDRWWEAALIPGEECGGVPSWAARVERVGAGEATDEDFAGVVWPLAVQAGEDLRPAMGGGVDAEAVRERFVAGLAGRLAGLAARVLVLELNVMRVRGELAGGTPEERFREFVARSREGLPALLRRYPVLARVLGQACEQAVEAGVELLGRFEADREELAGLVGEPQGNGVYQDSEPAGKGVPQGSEPAKKGAQQGSEPAKRGAQQGSEPADTGVGELVGFVAAGDRHRQGRAVCVLEFAGGGKVVYRPRPVTAHLHFNELVRWLNERVPGLELGTVRVLARDGYGWVEFAEAAPCTTAEQVSRFYRRQGALLTLLDVVNGTDIHYENLVACGDQPLVVDVETVLHPTGLAGPDTTDPALRVLRESVQRTALLPQFVMGDQGVLDVSGLGGDKEGVAPFSAATWEDAGTDTMRLVRSATRFTGAANRPMLAGVEVDPAEHVRSLIQGFQAAYHAIAASREELLAGLLRRFAGDEVRVVVRQSRLYAELLSESTHPDVMRQARVRDAVFHLLAGVSGGDPLLLAAVPYEVGALWAGDVPMFSTRGDSLELVGDDGTPLGVSLKESGLDAVTRKVATMGPADLADQEWIIRASLAARDTGDQHPVPTPGVVRLAPTPPLPETLLAAARGLADQLCADVHSDGERVNWLGLEPIAPGHWSVMPLGGGLATGYSGVALFLAQAGLVTGVEEYREVALRAVAGLPPLLEGLTPELAVAVGPGGFGGLGGIVYAVARLSVLLPGAGLEACLERALELLDFAIGEGTPPVDVYDGLAGGLAALCAVAEITGLERARAAADRCAEVLAARVREVELAPGFAFGGCGVDWALRRANRKHQKSRSTHESHRGRDNSVDHQGRSLGLSWCRGTPGRLLARVDDGRYGWKQVRKGIGDTLPLATHDLCHGELGRIELLTTLTARGDKEAASAMNRYAGHLLASLEQFGPRCGTPNQVPTPGLLTGLAGIGHGLLRLTDPERVPAVLLLR